MTKEIHDAVSDSVSTERALDLALEALDIVKIHFTQNRHVNDAITAIKQARSAPAQEPVAWMFEDDEGDKHKTFRQTPPSPEDVAYIAKWNRPAWVPLYTTPTATPVQSAERGEPVWIQPDHLQKAQKAPFLCRVEPHKRDDFVPLYTTPPGGRQSEDCLTAAQEDIQRLSALVRAQQITIDKLEAQRPVAEPHKWTGLTDEAIWSEYQTLWPFHPAEEPRLAKDIAKFARAIEAKLKEKNQ